MRTSMAYFAGAGTVIAAIGLGLGGGFTIANVMSPHQEKLEQTRLEQRMSAKPIPPSAPADQPKPQLDNVQASNTEANKPQGDQSKGPVPYVAATGAAVTANAPAAQGQPQTSAAAPQASPSPVVEQAKVDDQAVRPAEPQTAKPQTAPREQASSSPEDTNAKARSPEDANAKARDADLKRLAAEKRRADRRQQWADRKKAQQQRDAQLRGAEESVRRDTDPGRDTDGPRIVRRDGDGPRIVVRQDDGDSDRRGDFDHRGDRGGRPFGFPGFNLFGGDRDD
jgi:hypothetical protein